MNKFLKAARPQFWPISIVPGLVGLYLAGHRLPNIFTATIVIVGLSCLSALAETVNAFYDQETDQKQQPKKIGPIVLSGGSEAAQNGIPLPEFDGWVKFLAIVLLLVMTGALTNLSTSPIFYLLFVLGIGMAWFYTAPPLVLKQRGVWGLICIGLGRGFISFHFGWLLVKPMDLNSVAISLVISAVIFSTAMTAHLADYRWDKKFGVKTFPVCVGFDFAKLIGAAVLALALIADIVTKTTIYHPFLLIFPIVIWAFTFQLILDTKPNDDFKLLQTIGLILAILVPLSYAI